MSIADFSSYFYESHNMGDYMHFRLKGKECIEASLHFIAKAVVETEESGLFKILYEEEFVGQAQTMELVKISEYIINIQIEKKSKLKVAYVNLVENKMENDFFEDFLNNRGFNLKIFDNNTDAIEWLRS